MNKLLKVLFFFMLTIQKLQGMEDVNWNYGSQKISKKKIEHLYVNGYVELDSSVIAKELFVNGSLISTNSDIWSMKINGRAVLKQSLVHSFTNVNGFLEANCSKFENTVFVSSQVVEFKNCFLLNLVIKPVQEEEVQIIKLENGTQIDGDVIVESGKGKILISDDSKINGIIQGATISKK